MRNLGSSPLCLYLSAPVQWGPSDQAFGLSSKSCELSFASWKTIHFHLHWAPSFFIHKEIMDQRTRWGPPWLNNWACKMVGLNWIKLFGGSWWSCNWDYQLQVTQPTDPLWTIFFILDYTPFSKVSTLSTEKSFSELWWRGFTQIFFACIEICVSVGYIYLHRIEFLCVHIMITWARKNWKEGLLKRQAVKKIRWKCSWNLYFSRIFFFGRTLSLNLI